MTIMIITIMIIPIHEESGDFIIPILHLTITIPFSMILIGTILTMVDGM